MENMRKVVLILILSLLLDICEGRKKTTLWRYKELTKSTNDFTINLYREVTNTISSNVFLSPLGISTVLTLLLQGARGKTKSQLQNALQFENMDINNVNQAFKVLTKMLNQPNENYTLNFASKIYLQNNINLQEEYMTILNTFYSGKLEQIDFKKPRLAKQKINSWASEETNAKIPTIINTLSPSTLLIVLNAIYFKGNWMYYFESNKTQLHKFTTSEKTINVKMMSQTGKFKYGVDHEILKCKIVELPYTGKRLSMFILLPDSLKDLNELEKKLNYESLSHLINSMTEQQLSPLKIPKFKLESEYELIPTLREMGIKDLFENADLSGMLEEESDINVSEVLHKTFIEVNEKGSEAAAVTAAKVTKSLDRYQKQFVANRAFIFLIRDNQTGIILFIGRFKSPPKT